MKDTVRRITITIEAPGDDDALGQLARSVAQQAALAGWPTGTEVEINETMPIAGGGNTSLCLGVWTVTD